MIALLSVIAMLHALLVQSSAEGCLEYEKHRKDAWNMKNTELLPLFDGISENIEKVVDYISDRWWDDGEYGKEHALEMEINLNLLRTSISMLLDLKFKCSEIENIKEADFVQAKYIMLRAHYYAKLEEAETIRIETRRIVDDYNQAMNEVVSIEKEIKKSIDVMESKIIPKKHGTLKEPGVMGNDIAYGREEIIK
jgi:hypothetical protein